MAISGEFDGLTPLGFVSFFNTIRMSFSPFSTTGRRVGCAVEGKIEGEGEGVDEPPTELTVEVVVEEKVESVERREETNGFSDVLMLLVKGVEEGK